ncbi:MAG: hypothetical protein JOZ07_04525 [Solirubrobacterales bacterium]|nr:hypothetical protein [Solirubrobacterales bacterium]
MDAELAICRTCGTQFGVVNPERCPICEDPRQYVPRGGQAWTTLSALRRDHHNRFAAQGELTGIVTEPSFAIGQRALLVPFGERNLLWDCITLFDEDTAALVQRRGGLAAIAISHPHYYSAMVEWARWFDCPIHLPSADREWVVRPDPRIAYWDGDRLELGQGLTLIRTGGHFPGATVLHRAAPDGSGTLLAGDVCLPVPDARYVCFLWSYPNRVPLPAADVRRIGDAVAPFDFEVMHCAFWDNEVADAKRVWTRSIERFATAVQTPGGSREAADQ